MSKASQRRLSAQQARAKRRGTISEEEAELALLLSGPALVEEDPVAFWRLVGLAGPAGPKHQDHGRLMEVVEEYKGTIELLTETFHEPFGFASSDGNGGARHFGFLILSNFVGLETPVVLPMSPWLRRISALGAAQSLIGEVNRLPQEFQRDACLWCFTSEVLAGETMHCLAVSRSGAASMLTYVMGQWLVARATARAAQLAVGVATNAASEAGCQELAAAAGIRKVVRAMLRREMMASEEGELDDALRTAFDLVESTFLDVAVGSAQSAASSWLADEAGRDVGPAGGAGVASEVVREAKQPSQVAGPAEVASAGPKTKRSDEAKGLDSANKLLRDALARERFLGEKLQELRAAGGDGRGYSADVSRGQSVRERVSELFDRLG